MLIKKNYKRQKKPQTPKLRCSQTAGHLQAAPAPPPSLTLLWEAAYSLMAEDVDPTLSSETHAHSWIAELYGVMSGHGSNKTQTQSGAGHNLGLEGPQSQEIMGNRPRVPVQNQMTSSLSHFRGGETGSDGCFLCGHETPWLQIQGERLPGGSPLLLWFPVGLLGA